MPTIPKDPFKSMWYELKEYIFMYREHTSNELLERMKVLELKFNKKEVTWLR